MDVSPLPEITVVRPEPFWRWFMRRLVRRFGPATVVLVAFAVFIAVRNRDPAVIALGLIPFGAAAIVALEAPAILWLADHQQAKLLAASPPGTIFAARVSRVEVPGGAVSGPGFARRGKVPGILVVDRTGMSFTVSPIARGGPVRTKTSLSWQEVAEVALEPARSPRIGLLRVTSTTGQVVAWVCPGLPRLIQALDRLRAESADGSG
jgi:hypothetical protein